MIKKSYERDLYSPIIKKALSEGIPLYRIQDGSAGKKPFDIAGYWDCRPVAIEVKVVRSKTLPLPLSKSRGKYATHQLQWMNICANNNGIAIGMEFYPEHNRFLVYSLCGNAESFQEIKEYLEYRCEIDIASFELTCAEPTMKRILLSCGF